MSDPKTKLLVSNSKDHGSGSLRDAIEEANQSKLQSIEEIIIQPLKNDSQVITLTSEIKISCDVKIVNASGKKLTIKMDDSNKSRLFRISKPSNRVYFQSTEKSAPIILTGGNTKKNGGCILVEAQPHTLHLKDTIISNNHADSGGGIFSLGKVKLVNSVVENNVAVNQGGGIWAEEGIFSESSKIVKNKVSAPELSSAGGGVYVDNGDCSLLNSLVIQNKVAYISKENVGGSGGGIIVMKGNIYINNSKVDENSAFNSGGIQQGLGDIVMENKSSSNKNKSTNSATGSAGGGGIVITSGNVYVRDSEISDNETVGMYSGGIVSLVGNVSVLSSIISGNKNSGPGGGIAVNGGNIIVRDSKIINNVGASIGGGIASFAPSGTILISETSVVKENTVTNAQTIGGTIASFVMQFKSLLDSVVAQAKKSEGKGANELIQVFEKNMELFKSAQKQMNQICKTFHPLKSMIGGGGIGIFLPTRLKIKNVEITENSFVIQDKILHDTNHKIIANGGGIFNYLGQVMIENSKISKNKALSTGGGIWTKGNLTVEASIIVDNSPNNITELPNENAVQKLEQSHNKF